MYTTNWTKNERCSTRRSSIFTEFSWIIIVEDNEASISRVATSPRYLETRLHAAVAELSFRSKDFRSPQRSFAKLGQDGTRAKKLACNPLLP